MKAQSLGAMLWILIVLLVSGCEWLGPETRDWEEDVLLEDGSTIRIKRHVEFVDNNSLAGDAYSAMETAATLEFPKNLKVPMWSAPLRPLLLYRDNGQWVIVSSTTASQIWENRGKPCPPYWEYRLLDDSWHQMSLSDRSLDRKTNLFFSYDSRVPEMIGVRMKQEQLQALGIADVYTSIRKNPKDFNCR